LDFRQVLELIVLCAVETGSELVGNTQKLVLNYVVAVIVKLDGELVDIENSFWTTR
jgi:hypothetical protein